MDLDYGFDKVQNALWPYPSCCALKMHQLYVKSVVRDFNSILIYKILRIYVALILLQFNDCT